MAWHRARRGLAGPPHAALGLGDPDHPEAAAPRRPRALRLAGQRAAAAVHDAVHRVRHPDFRGGAAGTGDHPRGRLLLAADARHHGDADADPRAHPRRAGLVVDRGRGPPFRRLASGAVTVKFLRHLAAAVLVVAIILGLGMLWAHASGGTGVGSGPGRAPSPEALLRLKQIKENIKTGVIRVRSDNGFDLADTGNLIRTCEIEAVLAAVVITVNVIWRRRRRRMRRTAARA